MEQQNLIDWIRLINSENIGPITFRHLLKRYGSAAEALKALPGIAKRGGKQAIKIPDEIFAKNQIQQADNCSGFILALEDPEYPSCLKAIESAPPVLYVKGNKELLFNKNFGIVGSRNASLNGIKFTRELSEALGKAGLNIISGLAVGIDTAAHQGALETGTIAVLGGGLDVVYPKENKDLQNVISEQGILITEFPFNTPPSAHHFPRRNRIIAALSMGVLVVEARYQSGSMITAMYANEFGRDIFAVPGFPYDPRSEGPNKLISEGAYLVRNVLDIINNLPVTLEVAQAFDPKEYFPIPGPEVRGLTDMKSKIIELLSSSPIDIDFIIRHTELSPAYVWDVILELELSDKLERHGGNKVSLKA
jgi:DNA processing protein